MDSKKITIVINTFKSEDKICSCIDSIGDNFEIIVVENSSDLNFKKMLETKYHNVNCFLTGENLGYAKGNNFGLSKVTSPYALILNPDTIIVGDTLYQFLKLSKNLKDFSIIGPAKQDEFSKDDNQEHLKETFEVDKLKGFAMFLNIEKFKDIGFFDDNFFIYLEEIDLCKRLKEKEKKIYLSKNIKIEHLGGSSHSESVNFEMELSRNWHWMWSKFYFNKKHNGYFPALIKVSGKLFSSFIKMIFFAIFFKINKRKIYFQRFSGLCNSILGKKSWYRPKILKN